MIDVTYELKNGWLGLSDSEPPVQQSCRLARGSTPAPRRCRVVVSCHKRCLCFTDCCFAFLDERMERDWMVRGPHLREEILVINNTAQPREDSQVFVIARGTDQKENIGESSTAAE